MKVDVVIKLSRQVEGEYVFVNALRAFAQQPNDGHKQKIQTFLANTPCERAEHINGVDCMVEVGVLQDIEVEE